MSCGKGKGVEVEVGGEVEAEVEVEVKAEVEVEAKVKVEVEIEVKDELLPALFPHDADKALQACRNYNTSNPSSFLKNLQR